MHLVQNTMLNGEEFNWILTRKLSHEADLEITESWFQEGDMDDVRRLIETCDPRIAAAVEKTPSCLDWKICYRDPIPTWVSKSHRIVLLGDSCHPHLPTSAQGASQATESAAVLAVCLKLAGPDNIEIAVSWGMPSAMAEADGLTDSRREYMRSFASIESDPVRRMEKT